jgi:polar amino acid transport system substrate-binding protein
MRRKLVTDYLTFALLIASCALSHGAANQEAEPRSLRDGTTIDICDDAAEFPPYTFYKREGTRKTQTVTGITYDVAATILARHKLKFRVQLIPWKRCEEEAKLGLYAMTLSGAFSAKRAAAFYMIGPHSQVRHYYFYSRERHPDGLDIRNLADLRKYRICGINGYNSEAAYNLPNGFMDMGSTDFESLVNKILLGRCDLFLEGLEIMQGFSLVGHPFLEDLRLSGKPVPMSNPTASFYFMVSRQHPLGSALAVLFKRELEQITESGELKAIRERYLKPVK